MMRYALLFSLVCVQPLLAKSRSYTQAFPHRVESRYFDFRYQNAKWDAVAFARFADGFVDLINRDFLNVTFDYPIQVLVLPDRVRFQQYLRKEFGAKQRGQAKQRGHALPFTLTP